VDQLIEFRVGNSRLREAAALLSMPIQLRRPPGRRLEPEMPVYVQIMEIKTSQIDKVRALMEKMEAETGNTIVSTRALFTTDRDRPGYYLAIMEFNSYEEAMKQSNDPVTTDFAKQLSVLLDAPPKFYNLDVDRVMVGKA
jgi:hypothetical protein